MDARIEPYRAEDYPAISNLFPADWNFDFREFLSLHHGRTYFLGYSLRYHKQTIGFGNIIVFGSICWIGNIVVSDEYRNKGFGTKITQYLIVQGKSLGAVTFNLVATELGEPIYKKLGFVTEFNYQFFERKSSPSSWKTPQFIRKADHSDLPFICDLDTQLTGVKREEMHRILLPGTHLYCKQNQLKGFYVGSLGDGLIVAKDPVAGTELLQFKFALGDKKVVIPEINNSAMEFILSCGFEKTIQLPRMTMGSKIAWNPESIFSRGTGYCG